MPRAEHIAAYFTNIKRANKEFTKKELFKDLLHRLYPEDQEIQNIIDAISLGSEKTILNIPRKDKIHRGSADTLYNNIIIEFENDLSKTLNHAKEQLAGYMLGQYHSGLGYNYTLIASDFVTWKVYAPTIESVKTLGTLTESEVILDEIGAASFTLKESNFDDFFFWLDRFLFKEEKRPATLESIEYAFGYTSNVFLESFQELNTYFIEAKKFNEVQVSFEQWRKFLSIAYGSFDATDQNFLIHTYLSIFSKMLAYEILSRDEFIEDKQLEGILDGTIFHKYNIQNFVTNDFFHWVTSERSFNNLKKVFRLVAQELSNFDYDNVSEDVLKGVYQELIDLDTRHSLGEYYTPDWLCERVVAEFDFTNTDKILDPACGSGSFLRAAVQRLKKLNPKLSAEELNDCIHGIDIHPLSVQIAKTTLLLSLGKDVINARKPIHLNIILANTLLAPDGVQDLFGSEFQLTIDRERYSLNTQMLENKNVFDGAIAFCDELAEQTLGQSEMKLDSFEKAIKQYGANTRAVSGSFYKIYKGLKKAKENGRDGIWKFIILNLYKPYFLSNTFTHIVGNPPWFTYSSIRNEEYQDILFALADRYKIKPEKNANFPHLEIAAIFLAYCSNYFLEKEGKLAFVLPRSFFSADHHDNTRSGKAEGFVIKDIWDLDGVSPLFRIPSCVLFTQKVEGGFPTSFKKSGLDGKKIFGKIKNHNCNWDAASNLLTESSVKYYYTQRGKTSAFTNKKSKKIGQENPYKRLFKQGATIVPRGFYFVDINQEMPPDLKNRIINIKTAEGVKADAKKPWRGLEFENRIESKWLYRTAISKNVLPFHLLNPEYVTLPILIEMVDGKKKINLLQHDKIREIGDLNAARWFKQASDIWNIHKTEKNEKMTSENYLNWKNKLENQNLNAPFLVLYNSSAKDANSTVVARAAIDLEFIVESTAYVFYTFNDREAYYLSTILNSAIPNKLIKDFQAKGLFGARHVHKKILDVFYPKFDKKKEVHLRLAKLGEVCHKKANDFVKENPPTKLTPYHLGRYRLDIKKHLSKELEEIDKIVKELVQ